MPLEFLQHKWRYPPDLAGLCFYPSIHCDCQNLVVHRDPLLFQVEKQVEAFFLKLDLSFLIFRLVSCLRSRIKNLFVFWYYQALLKKLIVEITLLLLRFSTISTFYPVNIQVSEFIVHIFAKCCENLAFVSKLINIL